MELYKFKKLLSDFESNIIINGIIKKRFITKTLIPTKNCKLSNHDFGKKLGMVIDTDIILVIDYYGYLKKSKGFINKLKTRKLYLKELESYLVYFASVKMEDIAFMTSNVSVMIDFPRLKNEILIFRGFRKRI